MHEIASGEKGRLVSVHLHFTTHYFEQGVFYEIHQVTNTLYILYLFSRKACPELQNTCIYCMFGTLRKLLLDFITGSAIF